MRKQSRKLPRLWLVMRMRMRGRLRMGGRMRMGVRLWLWLRPLAVWFAICLMTAGCWDYHDINHRSVPVIIGVAKGEEHPYKVSLQIPIPAEGKLHIKVVSREASTISECVDSIRIDVENYIDLLSVQLIVISQELAKEGLQDEWANAVRSQLLSPKTLLAITDGDMETLLSNTKNAVANDITTFYKFANKRAGWTPKTAKTNLLAAFASTRSYTQDVIIPIIRPGRETVMEFTGSALMKKGKMVGRLNEHETLLINVISNHYYGADVEVLQNASVTIRSADMDWSTRMTENGPELVGDLSLQTTLTESKTEKPLSQHAEDLKAQFSAKLEHVTDKLIRLGSDPLGLGNHFRSKLPFDKLANWRSDYYPKLKVSYRVHVKVNNFGNLIQAE